MSSSIAAVCCTLQYRCSIRSEGIDPADNTRMLIIRILFNKAMRLFVPPRETAQLPPNTPMRPQKS